MSHCISSKRGALGSFAHAKYWLTRVMGTSTNECAAGIKQLETYLKLLSKWRSKARK